MPLCPQITNTPITVTQTIDFTVTSVVPAISDTTDGLTSNLESIEILADGKTKVYRAAAEPTGAGINNGDLWIDTDDGNKLYVRSGGVWVSAQDGAISTAQSTANTALSNAAAAQSSANTALSNAAAAQSSANTAITNAAAAQSSANTALSNAATAQSTANTALANAATAYTAAVGSLQPSASTIVNASNQMTAISSNGITVYSGASATTGARVVLNSAGLAGFNSSSTGPGNGATFSINASTGAAVFSGNVTGATITGSDLNINGKFIVNGTTGVMTATDAVVTGNITATTGTFTGTVIANTGSFTGTVIATTGIFTGTVIATTGSFTGTVTATTGTFTGTVIANTGTFTGTVIATTGSFTGAVFAASGTIGGTSITSTTLTGGIIQTSTGSNAVILEGSSNALQFKAGGSVVCNLLNFGSSGALLHYGSTPNSSGTSYPLTKISSSSASIEGSSGQYFSAGAGGNLVVGQTTYSGGTHTFSDAFVASSTATFNSTMFAPNLTTSTSATNLRVTTGSIGEIQETSASSIRFKENVVPLSSVEEINHKKLLDLPVRAFTYKEGYLSANDDRLGVMLPGFIAEEVDAIYPIAADYGDGQAHSWNERFIIPGLLALIQDLYKEVQLLKGE